MKWTSEAGPRQTKQVQDAMRAADSAARTYFELEGILEKPETHKRSQFGYIEVFGPGINPLFPPMVEALYQKHGGRITRENYQAIIAGYQEIARACAAEPMIRDKRKSLAQVEEEEARRREWEAEAARRAAEEDLKPKVEHLSPAEVAAEIKAKLTRAFPGVRFSCKSDRTSVSVSWTDGPTAKQVEKITDAYVGRTFDGMQDLESFCGPCEIEPGRRIQTSVYVNHTRYFGIETLRTVVNALREHYPDQAWPEPEQQYGGGGFRYERDAQPAKVYFYQIRIDEIGGLADLNLVFMGNPQDEDYAGPSWGMSSNENHHLAHLHTPAEVAREIAHAVDWTRYNNAAPAESSSGGILLRRKRGGHHVAGESREGWC